MKTVDDQSALSKLCDLVTLANGKLNEAEMSGAPFRAAQHALSEAHKLMPVLIRTPSKLPMRSSTTKPEPILNCPFCSSTKPRASNPRASNDKDFHTAINWWVECRWCGAIGPNSTTKEGAVEKWNKRTPLLDATSQKFADGAEIAKYLSTAGGVVG